MSRIQDAAKPLLFQMMNGNWPALDEYAQRKLANWAIMTTMVIDFADKHNQATTFQERETFRLALTPPTHWLVWIGWYREFRWSFNFWHKGIGFEPENQQAPHSIGHCDTQITTFAFGQLLVQTASSTSEIVRPHLHGFDYSSKIGLRQIWPFNGTIGRKPDFGYGDGHFDGLANLLAMFLDRACT
jgi:hypothetical protein